ncbi:MAG: hypothetical protein EOM26_05315 [Alphaproteobacteria bacterium]|nr:hypothetical protein [Alphaproteobacteria bacterium]
MTRNSIRNPKALKGCLLGMALGDALGFHVEGKDSERVAELVALTNSCPAAVFPFRKLAAFELVDWITGEHYESGQISDDTQMALLVARAYATGQGVEGLAGSLAEGFQRGTFAGYGHTTRKAAQNFLDGKPLGECGLPSGSNGAAMRVAPLAVLIEDEIALVRATEEQARITHTHPDSVEAAVAQAVAVRAVLDSRGVALDAQALADRVAGCAPDIGRELRAMFRMGEDEARAHVLAIDRTDTPHQSGHGLSSYGPPCVAWAIYAFAQTSESPWQTISKAISIGGDTDTVAAMAGALAGVYKGREALPHWTEQWLHDRGKKPDWDFENEQRKIRHHRAPFCDAGGPERG